MPIENLSQAEIDALIACPKRIRNPWQPGPDQG